jgi:hypothetical protein
MSVEHHGKEPDLELLRIAGWNVIALVGCYCSAWRAHEQAVMIWANGAWRRLGRQ